MSFESKILGIPVSNISKIVGKPKASIDRIAQQKAFALGLREPTQMRYLDIQFQS